MTRAPDAGRSARAPAPPLAVAALLGGYLVWSAAFVALYALHGLACAFVAGDSVGLRAALGAVWLAHVAAGVALLSWLWRHACDVGEGTTRFVAQVAVTLAATGIVATAWTGLPLLLTRACEPPPRPEARSAHAVAPVAADPRAPWNASSAAGSTGRQPAEGAMP